MSAIKIKCPSVEVACRPPQPTSLPEKSRYSTMIELYRKTSFQLETTVALSEKYKLKKDEVCKIVEAVSAVCELYTIFGLASPRSQQWLKTRETKAIWLETVRVNHGLYKAVHHLLRFVSENGMGSWVKLLKWKFASFFAFHRQQDIPRRPDMIFSFKSSFLFKPDELLGGIFRDFLMRLKSKNFDRFMQFSDTSQQLKKSMPEVPIEMVVKAEHDTLVELTSPVKEVPDDQGEVILVRCTTDKTLLPGETDYQRYTLAFGEDEVFEEEFGRRRIYYEKKTTVTKTKVVEALRRTTRELFHDEVIDHHEIFEPFFPSTSANYIWSRKNCGALAELYDRVSFGKRESGMWFGSGTCSLFQRVSPHFGEWGKSESIKIAMEKDLGHEYTEEHPVLFFDSLDLRRSWQEDYCKIFELAKTERPLVETVGLPEPLKVRVISKGPPLLYTVLKPFQRFLWRVLKKHKVFSLIGRYVLPSDIERVLGGIRENEEAVSGDYVSSTNKLHSWVSEVILDELMIFIGENIPRESLAYLPNNFMIHLKNLFLKALTKHIFVETRIDYESCGHGLFPCQYCKDLSPKYEHPQTEGQLMGSIISFPFLCIANAALCRLAIEESNFGRPVRIVDTPFPGSGPLAPLLINGDDCLLKGAKGRLRRCWEAYCAVAGLESSLGKTYFSDSFCTINSTIFERQKDRWIERKYVNLGLMMGRRRIGAGKKESSQVEIHQLGTICRELKRSCPIELWPTVKSRFIYYNFKELNKFPIPWFLPEWLGGLGLPVDNPNEISRTDRLCASIIKYNLGLDRPLEKLRPVLPKDAAKWLMHKKVMRDLREFEYLGQPLFKKGVHSGVRIFELEDEYAKLYKMMTINLLQKEPLESLYEILDEDHNVNKSLWHNATLFSIARNHIGSSNWEPMSDQDMVYENKDLVLPCCEYSKGEYTASYYEDRST